MTGMEKRRLRYAFYGSGGFGARCLDLLSEWIIPEWIVTAAPKEAGRGRKLRPTPVAEFARNDERLGVLPLIETALASSDEAVASMKRDKPVDFSFVVDFGQIVKEPILEWESKVGCLNIHPSLLPRYRGAAPIQRALMDCAGETGVTIFKLARGVDSGPVLMQRRIDVSPDDDAASLMERCAAGGVSMFVEYARSTLFGDWRFTDQDDSLATYAPKISSEEERIDWSVGAGEILGKIKALSPRPCAWTTAREKRMRIISADAVGAGKTAETGFGAAHSLRPGEIAVEGQSPFVGTGDGILRLKQVQMEGKKIQDAAVWLNGFRAAEGELLV